MNRCSITLEDVCKLDLDYSDLCAIKVIRSMRF